LSASASLDLEQIFQRAAAAYLRSVEGFQLTPAERESAAHEFSDEAKRFWSAGEAALSLAEGKLQGPYAVVASRLLLASADPAAQRVLVTALARPGPRRLPPRHLALLGRRAPPPPELRAVFDKADRMSRPKLLRALLRHPTPDARTLLADTLAAGPDDLAVVAVRAAAGWGDASLLRSFVDGPGETACFRLEAAFQLGLAGDRAMVARLQAAADGRGTMAAEACRYLAQLAWPSAVASIATLLRGPDREAAELALQSVRLLGAMALGPVLIELADRASGMNSGDGTLGELAITALADLTGAPIPDERSAASFFRERLAAFDLRLRYWSSPPNRLQAGARPVTPGLLAEELLDAANPELSETAGNQLRAVTGEDYGFDPDADLIENLPAIAAWRARAHQPLPVEPGGWIYFGQPLPPPPTP
jgi:hypothetical protein